LPRAARCQAVAQPMMPPPTIATSADSIAVVLIAILQRDT
jgi:hypothetical protein